MQIAKSLMMRTPPNQELFDELVSQDIDIFFHSRIQTRHRQRQEFLRVQTILNSS